MGTSTSSGGPGPGVSLDPPWLDDIGAGDAGGESNGAHGGDGGGDEDAPGGDGSPAEGSLPAQLAPARRFAAARRDLSTFARTGDTRNLGRGIGHYSRSGMGGSRQAANRMRASTRAGAGLGSFLQQVRDGATAEARRWVDELVAGAPSADAVVDAIVEAVMPAGGSADEESIRDSMAIALSDLMVISPECDVLRMSAEDTWTLMQLYLSREVCNRLRFDMGQGLESARLNPAVSVQRELEMRQFVRNEISVQLTDLRVSTPNPTQRQLDGLMQDALRLTFAVYEGVT
jgi:hypothetical protein